MYSPIQCRVLNKDSVVLSTFYCGHIGVFSRLLFKQTVFLIANNKSCQVSFLKKGSRDVQLDNL